jgi:hypothetical protein
MMGMLSRAYIPLGQSSKVSTTAIMTQSTVSCLLILIFVNKENNAMLNYPTTVHINIDSCGYTCKEENG